MPRKKQTLDSSRRTPRQARARAKVATLFEAAIQILQREGRGALTTNRIAERAGVGISTVYQYFENNDALLVALAREELRLHREAVAEAMSGSAPDADLDRRVIHAVRTATAKRSRLRWLMIEMMTAHNMVEELVAPAKDIERMIVADRERLLPGVRRSLSAVELFVLTRAMQGVFYAALREQSPLLHTPEFEDELVKLLRGYVAQLEQGSEEGNSQ
jgi:AcrR family transcriptional regulator